MILGTSKLLEVSMYWLSNVLTLSSSFDIGLGAFGIDAVFITANLALCRKLKASCYNATLVAFQSSRAILLSC